MSDHKKIKYRDNSSPSKITIDDVETQLNGGYALSKHKDTDMSPGMAVRSRVDTQTLNNKSNVMSNDSPSTPASELSEDGIEMLPTVRSENMITHGVETESSPLNFGKFINQQTKDGFKIASRNQLHGKINNIEQAK